MKLWYETVLSKDYPPLVNNTKGMSDIIFLHGTGSGSVMWKNQVKYFSTKGYPCTVIDLRGHGSSHEPYEKTNLNAHKRDILETLKIANIKDPAYFVGHSLGAILSLAIAEEYPSLVKSVFAACVPGKVLSPVTKTFEMLISGPLQTLKESDFKQYLGWREQALVEMPIFTLKEIVNNFADLDLLNHTPQVQCPVHIACARFDPIALCWHAKAIHQKLPGSTLRTFEWAGHNVMDYRVNDFNNWIESYLH